MPRQLDELAPSVEIDDHGVDVRRPAPASVLPSSFATSGPR